MRVLHISAGLLRLPPTRGGGVESMLLQVARRTAEGGHQVVVLDRRYRREDAPAEAFGEAEIHRVRSVSLDPRALTFLDRFTQARAQAVSFLNQATFALAVRRYIRDHGPFDVLHVHNFVLGAALVATAPRLRERMVYTSHVPAWAQPSAGATARVGFALELYTMRHVALVTALNRAIRDRIAARLLVPPESIPVVPVGVDTTLFTPSAGLDGWFPAGARPRVLFVGRISPEKGVEHLVEAARLLVGRPGLEGVHIVLAGPIGAFASQGFATSPYFQRVSALVQRYSLKCHVTFTNTVSPETLRRLHAACDIFVLPSLAEASPQALLEAQASGKPVVATPVGGVPEQVQDGWNGFLVPPGDPERLAERIAWLAGHPEERARMGANARRVAEEVFDWRHVARACLAAYERLRGPNGSRPWDHDER